VRHNIAAVPFTLRNLREDLEDVGHTHAQQEELYVVVGGGGRMKLDDEIVEVKELEVVRVPPGTWRGYEAGPAGLEILVFGAPNLGDNPRGDVEGRRDWWADG
jgi:mannose-6-phosphate isomerase-like protein (cupin superfamily)